MSRFLGVWPILDDTLTMPDLRAEADETLATLAWAQGVVVVEDPRWTIAEGQVDGYPSPTGLYLMAEAEARGLLG